VFRLHLSPTRSLRALVVSASLTIAAVTGVVSYRDWHDYVTNAQMAAQVRDEIERTQDLLSLIKDAETSQRGYLLTGGDQYLGPYRAAVPRIRQIVDSSRAEKLQPLWKRLVVLVNDRLQELADTIELRQRGEIGTATIVVRTDLGDREMERIRNTGLEIIRDLERQLQERAADARWHETGTFISVVSGTGILVLLLLGTTMYLGRTTTALDEMHRRESHERATVETTLQSIGDAIIATDSGGAITFMNRAAEALTGWPASEVTGRPLTTVIQLVSETSGATLGDAVTELAQRKNAAGGLDRLLLRARDGRQVPVDDSTAPIRHRTGAMAGAVLVLRDATERRQAERDLEESERRYRLLFENNPQPMWVFDLETLAFLAVNDAAVRNYGYSREEFLAMTLKDIRPAEDIPKLLDDVRVSPGQLHSSRGWRHQKKDGSIIQVEIIAHPIEFAGRSARLVLASDVTERQKLEEQFRQAQRLESVGRLAGGVAHDFNNLLTVISGYTEMAISELAADSEVSVNLREVRAAGERAAALTQQLLAFSRKQLVQPVVLNINDTIVGIEKMLRRLIGEDVELVSKLEPVLGNVKADGRQIEQIIMNLAVNARDAMPNGGSLVIETANVLFDGAYVAAHPDVSVGRFVMVAASDTGMGMTPEVKARIFEPFFTTKEVGSGTGLGLATVYGMVRQAGGWIWVYSEVGRGATFKIYLPVCDEPAQVEERPQKIDARGRETILLVEDQPEVRALAVAGLERFGYRVISAGSGADALSLCQQMPESIDLLVTDVIMPGMNGRALADQLTILRPGLRVLFMSGYTENAIAHHRVLEPGVAFIQKPFTPDSLAEKVREVLGQRSGAKILVVDDDDAVRLFLKSVLADAGFLVSEAVNGRQALAMVRKGPEPNVILTDLVMPEQEGIETIQQLRQQYPAIPVIAMSGALGGEYLQASRLLGAKASISKPILPDELLGIVRSVLEHREPGRL
jgi:two-component system cell cycle sensor histidine kinase/response regulator CckA